MTDCLKTNSVAIIKERVKAVPIGRLGTVWKKLHMLTYFLPLIKLLTLLDNQSIDGGQVLPETDFSEFKIN